MMMNGANSFYPHDQVQGVMSSSSSSMDPNPAGSHQSWFLYNLSLMKEKFNQVQSLAALFLSPPHESTPAAAAIPTMSTLIQEIIFTASSMMFSCQQMSLATNSPPPPPPPPPDNFDPPDNKPDPETGGGTSRPPLFPDYTILDHCTTSYNCSNPTMTELGFGNSDENLNSDIVELAAADLLAKYTHYCEVCGKGFKRDANLRMHMRAHGEEYKSAAALTNPRKTKKESMDNNSCNNNNIKYSCPQEGCRWNKKHSKFQPLKSMICVKNHYKRSHCPKMYVCKRCNQKQFSVLSDLRTHEKHCGNLRWRCSCGTTFSRKDKLMGHVALFAGHVPAIIPDAAPVHN
ncbi:protein SENSITIVE TO PROTON RHIZOTOXICITY 2-like [Andrographis paniculata]|uniref:protein SENSITIVE TO PROTON RHIZOTOXICITY 2-like n=1 Tax=Andrographis paniculata TaxID=175694 RepID=UPI0021E88DEA|nr:protein SENSITIVE TO PROTON RHIZOTOXICITY 2-like [Andrographis paniculata]